ncbi:MAG: nuclear transport factor 2 family protein [Planctomycetes bacterium]|nr:nuclear transport factor 2 family protein [Planctomycetota bacterium]
MDLTPEQADAFAKHHVETWNSHDLDAILGLYTDDVEFISPLAAKLTGSAHVVGKPAARAYFEAGLAKYPDLSFRLLETLVGAESITLMFYGAGERLVAEVLFLDDDGKIRKVLAHYA